MDLQRHTLGSQSRADCLRRVPAQLGHIHIPHFYRSFYVYKYATGIVSAVSIACAILEEGEPAVRRYFRFLESGGKTCPVDILKEAGVDLTSRAPFERAMREFADTLREFEELQN